RLPPVAPRTRVGQGHLQEAVEIAAGAPVRRGRGAPPLVERPIAGVELKAAVHRLSGPDRLDARHDEGGTRHESREVRDHEDDESDQREGPQDREDGSSPGRRRRRPVGPRRGRQAASGAEVSAEEGATPRARPLHGRGGHGHRRRADVSFETIRAEKVNFGRNNFLEVARKRATTSEGTKEFISVSRGYYLPDKTERFKRSLTIPDDPEVRAFVADKNRTL